MLPQRRNPECRVARPPRGETAVAKHPDRPQTPPAVGAGAGRSHALAHAACLGLLGSALALWSWRKWADVQVDFGRELYVAWRLSEGAALYKDIAYFNGPLSPYVNALLFRLFGVHATTLVAANLVLLAATAVLLYRLLARVAGRAAATVCLAVFLSAFAFAQLVSTGNYNFVCPYSHEATHGLLLGLAAIALASRWARAGRARDLGWAGLCVGLAFLTKAEMFASALAATLLGILLWARREPSCRATLPRALLLYGGGLLVPSLAFAGIVGVDGIFAHWILVGRVGVVGNPFYVSGAGLDRAGANALALLRWCAHLAVPIAAGLLIGRTRSPRGSGSVVAIGAAYCAAAAVILHLAGEEFWYGFGRVLPVTTAVCAAWAIREAWRRAPAGRAAPTDASLLAMLATFSLALLAKMLLFAKIWHYGFVLAMPATMLLLVALFHILPRSFAGSPSAAAAVRGVGVAVALALAAESILVTRSWYVEKSVAVGRDGDRLWAPPGHKGDGAEFLIASVERLTDRDGTLAVLPEGVMINYLARRRNPTRYIHYLPPDMAAFGEEGILAALEAAPPDVIALVPKGVSEYGRGRFGEPGYGEAIMAWVRRNYRTVASSAFAVDAAAASPRLRYEVLAREATR